MSRRIELTDRVQRIESIEQKLGITIQSIYAVWTSDEYSQQLTVNFDVLGGSADLDDGISLVASVYNDKNQLIGTSQSFIDEESFVGFESISLTLFDVLEPPALIRVTPKPF
ncbi:hypothetical protein G6016_02040 [Dietzia aerolata]|uniref:Uncharacterized protein n=1 Tax=Dietzia aerolata TaxID=595984 RepID=A0ABV5JTC6_9ACTN|nr:hypothetical protein [Dietzia aerolata]MBB0967758.1 hypothetical protein [Dietzia aerolata]